MENEGNPKQRDRNGQKERETDQMPAAFVALLHLGLQRTPHITHKLTHDEELLEQPVTRHAYALESSAYLGTSSSDYCLAQPVIEASKDSPPGVAPIVKNTRDQDQQQRQTFN